MPPDPDAQIDAVGGWCAPAETVYELPSLDGELCADCRARLLFASQMGFDPGRHGENIRVNRGGVKYEVPDWRADNLPVPDENVCGVRHPRRDYTCTLPAGHGPVAIGNSGFFSHVCIDDSRGINVGWRLT